MVFERFTRAKTSSQKRFSQPIRFTILELVDKIALCRGMRIPDSDKFCLCNPESRTFLLVESVILSFANQNTA